MACTIPGCKGRHIQKLHDFLKDVFREENRVHVVHGVDGWEESDEAWELGEEEMMIVGTVQQEDECSWQEVCNTWEAQDEEASAGVYQVRVNQEISEPVARGQCKKASTEEGGEQSLEVGDLLVEGEEQEYFLELLMRRASPERSEGPPAKSGTCSIRDRRRKNEEKKARKKNLAKEAASGVAKEKEAVDLTSGKEKQVASNLAHNPEAKGRGLAEEGQQKKIPQHQPDLGRGVFRIRRVRNIPEVVLVRRWVSWGSGNLEGEGWARVGRGWVKGGQFTSNLRPRWTIPVTARRVPSKKKGHKGGERGIGKGGLKQGECAMYMCIL